jgi:hypothetical protein
MATAHGVNGYDAGRSVDRYVADVDPEIPLYLNPPVVSGAEPLVPEASGLRFTMNERSDEFGGMFLLLGQCPGHLAHRLRQLAQWQRRPDRKHQRGVEWSVGRAR